MNVGQLRKALAALPGDMPILLDAECGAENEVNLYLIPANRDRYGWIGVGHVSLNTEWSRTVYAGHDNITALHISAWGCGEDAEDITPELPKRVIDGEIAPLEIGR